MMRRREFITLVGGAAAWPLAARAQQPNRMRRIGVLTPYPADEPEGHARLTAFAQALQQSGWAVGQNVQIDYRWGDGKPATGVNLVHVPYRGAGPALVDLLGGQVQVMFATMSSSIEYVRAGKLRALAVTTTTRSPVLPDIPTVAEFVPGYEFSFWTGVGAPRNTPAEIVDKLNTEINAALADPKLQARLAEWGATALPGSVADFGKLIAEETEKWGKVVKFAGVKAD